jgi:iron complex transport system substrate-binding protein
MVTAVTVVTVAWALPPVGYVRGLKPAKAPGRLVSLAPSTTEILFSLGLGDRVVGVTRYCEHPPAAKALPKVGGFVDPSLEAVLALRPDAVVAVPTEGNQRVVERLVDFKVPVLLVPGITLADVFTALETLGEALGRKVEAGAVAARMRADLEEVRRRTVGRKAPRVLLIYDRRPLVVAGPGSFGDELLRLSGGLNVVPGGGVAHPTVSMEAVVGWAPEVVLDASMGGQDAALGQAQLMAEFGRFPAMPAVRDRRVLVLKGGGLMRPGPGIGADVATVAALLHPGAFGIP